MLNTKGIHEKEDLDHYKIIFWVDFVQVSAIHTQPSLVIDFLHHHHICQPIEIHHLPNDSGGKEFIHLLNYCLMPFAPKISLLLMDGGEGWVDFN
jgi:hypothetical protein